MKKHVLMLALLATITVLTACKKEPEKVIVQFSVGNAKIISASGEKAASSGAVVLYNDSITTGPSSVVDLNFGTKGVIRIAENSNVKISALGNEQVEFDMKKGKIIAILSKLSKGSSFRVMTPTTLAAIRGTSFMVVSDPKDSRIYVLKGRILVQLAKEGKLAENIEKMLEANKKVIVSEELVKEIIAGKKQIEVAPLTPKEISSIKEEIKNIKISENLDPDVQKEFTEILRDSNVKSNTMKKQEPPNKDIPTIPSI